MGNGEEGSAGVGEAEEKQLLNYCLLPIAYCLLPFNLDLLSKNIG